jgi:hypothetical protein
LPVTGQLVRISGISSGLAKLSASISRL